MTLRRSVLLAFLSLAVALVAGCGGGSVSLSVPDDDPVEMARVYGEAEVTCDEQHAAIALAVGSGWTAYVPEAVDAAEAERRQALRVQDRIALCERENEPGSTVSVHPVSVGDREATVDVRITGPSGATRTVRMEFFNTGATLGQDDRWSRRS